MGVTQRAVEVKPAANQEAGVHLTTRCLMAPIRLR